MSVAIIYPRCKAALTSDAPVWFCLRSPLPLSLPFDPEVDPVLDPGKTPNN